VENENTFWRDIPPMIDATNKNRNKITKFFFITIHSFCYYYTIKSILSKGSVVMERGRFVGN